MKEKKIAKSLRKHILMLGINRETLLTKKELSSSEKEDLKDCTEALLNLTFTHNYFSCPDKHIDVNGKFLYKKVKYNEHI